MMVTRRRLLRRGGALGLALAGGALVVWRAAPPARADGPKITIDTGKKHITRKPDQVIDPRNPPPDILPGHDAFTHCAVTCHARVPENGADARIVARTQQGCTVEVTVKTVEVVIGLEITVYLPPAPPATASAEEKRAYQTLKAHEEGHATICREVFELVAKKLADDAFKNFPKTLQLPVNPCTPEAIKAAVAAKLDALVKTHCETAGMAIHGACDGAGEAYDAATESGTKGPKKGGKPGETEPATPENQAAAAEEAIKQARKDFNQQQ